MIESEVYKLSAGAYMRQLFPLYLKRRWWLFVLVALPFPVLALWNLNFLYAALMVEFFVIPMMLGLAYFYYALSEECVSSIRRCRVRIGEGGIEREFVDGKNAVVSVKRQDGRLSAGAMSRMLESNCFMPAKPWRSILSRQAHFLKKNTCWQQC